VSYFEQAIAIESGFALGWAGLADAHTLLGEYGVTGTEASMPQAKRAALRAIELDPSLGEAWTSLAQVLGVYEWEHEEAEECYRKGISLNPGYATVHHWFGVDHLAMLGRFDEAQAEIRMARLLDPWSTAIIESEGYIRMLCGKYEDAIQLYQEALTIDPGDFKAWTSIGRALIQQGNYREAVEAIEKGRALAGDVPHILGALGQAHALAGDGRRARNILQGLEKLAEERFVPSMPRAIIHLGLGQIELALDHMERACERRETPLNGLKVHPLFDPLRSNPRFERLLRRVRLA
jgi:serine/threonine-protein kinase